MRSSLLEQKEGAIAALIKLYDLLSGPTEAAEIRGSTRETEGQLRLSHATKHGFTHPLFLFQGEVSPVTLPAAGRVPLHSHMPTTDRGDSGSVLPPSMTKGWPVMYAASSDARKAAS